MLITNLIQTEIELFKIIIDAPKFSKEELVLYIDEHFNELITEVEKTVKIISIWSHYENT